MGQDEPRPRVRLDVWRRLPFGLFWILAAGACVCWYPALGWLNAPPDLRAPASLTRVLALPVGVTAAALLFLLGKWRQSRREAGRG
ncbi:MAG: hypothetical protein JSR98_20520 [Proteobacteria bacterium]|nr:hypothetical protein [Pseudomonadota bacterium]